MAALGLPDDPAKQKRILIGALPLLILFGYWWFFHGDRAQELEAMETRVERLETANRAARVRAAESRQLEERLAQFERHIVRLEELVPRNEEVSQLLNQVNDRAVQSGVEVARFTPGQTDVGEHYNRRVFEMTVVGPYHNIGRFLSEVGSLPRIITPRQLSIIPNRNQPDRLEASFRIETYVLPDPQQAPPAQAGAGA